MNHMLKNTAKFAIATCFTLGAVAAAASVAASCSIGKLVSAGIKGAKNAVKEELAAQKTAEETAIFDDAEEGSLSEAETVNEKERGNAL